MSYLTVFAFLNFIMTRTTVTNSITIGSIKMNAPPKEAPKNVINKLLQHNKKTQFYHAYSVLQCISKRFSLNCCCCICHIGVRNCTLHSCCYSCLIGVRSHPNLCNITSVGLYQLVSKPASDSGGGDAAPNTVGVVYDLSLAPPLFGYIPPDITIGSIGPAAAPSAPPVPRSLQY